MFNVPIDYAELSKKCILKRFSVSVSQLVFLKYLYDFIAKKDVRSRNKFNPLRKEPIRDMNNWTDLILSP